MLEDLEAARLEDPAERERLQAEENRLAHGVRLQQGVMTLLGRLVEGVDEAPSALDHLAGCEAELAQMQQLERPIGRFDLDHLREIHRRAFGDVYEWAGKTRGAWTTIEGERFMPPAGLIKGGTRFADGPMVEPFLRDTFRQLERDDQLRGLSRPEFAGKAAELMGDMNAAHPFREGNGRTQREFMRSWGLKPATS